MDIKKLIKEIDGKLVIDLGDKGRLFFEPLPPNYLDFDSAKKYSATLKINHVMTLSRLSLSYPEDREKTLKRSIICSLNYIKNILSEVQEQIRNSSNNKDDLNEKDELYKLKKDIQENMSINYIQGETKPKSITFYGEEFVRKDD